MATIGNPPNHHARRKFTDWLTADLLMTAANTVAGYQVYGALLNDATLGETYVIGIDATDSTDPVIGPGTVIYLNTDQNNTTGFSPFGNVGAEYEVLFAIDSGWPCFKPICTRSHPPASRPCSTAGRRSPPAFPAMAKASNSRSRSRC